MEKRNERVEKLKNMLKLLRAEQRLTGKKVYVNTISQYEEELIELEGT
jgi:hypothetical protein